MLGTFVGNFVWNFCFGTFVGNFRGELLFGNFWGNPRPFCLALQFARGTLAPAPGEPAEATHIHRTVKRTSKNPSSLRLVREKYESLEGNRNLTFIENFKLSDQLCAFKTSGKSST